MFKKDDKIKIKESSKLFAGKTGTVLEANDHEAKVQIDLDESNENMKNFVNIFVNEDLELMTELETLITEDIDNEEAAFTNDEFNESEDINSEETSIEQSEKDTARILSRESLEYWLADKNANYLTQEITENFDCPIRNEHGQVIANYNFKTGKLVESLYDETFPDIDGEHCEDVIPDCDLVKEDFIHDYLYDENIDDLNDVIPSWEFVQIIATSENIDDETVIQEAIDRGYKMFVIRWNNYERLVIAAKGITADDIYADYADYLEGNPTVTELKNK